MIQLTVAVKSQSGRGRIYLLASGMDENECKRAAYEYAWGRDIDPPTTKTLDEFCEIVTIAAVV